MTAALAPFDGAPPPRHIAIIMDGNGRWARARGLPRTLGHKAGVDAVQRCVRAAADAGVEHLTLFGFSSENWRRSESEVSELMGLLRLYLNSQVSELIKNGVRLSIIGDRARLPADIVKAIDKAEAATAHGRRVHLTVALSYGARDEIAQAAKALAEEVASGVRDPQSIDPDALATKLQTAHQPDPDLILRTSGEQRLSNFLLWQCAYAELMFIDKYWPDFAAEDLFDAVAAFQKRDRRFGAVAG